MDKTKLEPNTILTAPVVLIGTKSAVGKINFATFAWVGIINSEPPMIGLAVRKSRLTHEIITATNVFSVNIPTSKIIKETDYCGMVSGKNVNKDEICGFNIFYGNLENAPLINECSINHECEVKQVIEFPSHDYFISEIKGSFVDKNYYDSGQIKYDKIDSFIYLKKSYRKLADDLGAPYSLGTELKK